MRNNINCLVNIKIARNVFFLQFLLYICNIANAISDVSNVQPLSGLCALERRFAPFITSTWQASSHIISKLCDNHILLLCQAIGTATGISATLPNGKEISMQYRRLGRDQHQMHRKNRRDGPPTAFQTAGGSHAKCTPSTCLTNLGGTGATHHIANGATRCSQLSRWIESLPVRHFYSGFSLFISSGVMSS
jgi:hypothetical protein